MEKLEQCGLCLSRSIETLCQLNSFGRCLECGYIFDNPRPDWKEIIDFYSKETQYDEWLKEEKARDDLWMRRLRLLLKYVSKGRLLDVGAGIGQFLWFATKHFEVHGTEISSVAVKIAKEKYGIELIQGTLDDIAEDPKYDVITMFHVLEHVPYPRTTLLECFKRLNPGGTLILAVPNDVDSILTRRNRMMARLNFRKYLCLGKLGLPKLSLTGSEIHLSHFTGPVLASALKQTGFQKIETSLDPYFSVSGMKKLRRYCRYAFYLILKKLVGINLYDTIWVVAQK